ncbi:hypothetical protein ACSV5M_15570 [Cellvibrio sp. ARAG 10.3]|uniref:hypothetical protein n=1 Tax=Cellvibrio sp. ARAG 10.3 TaxID=3451358 RepID=UPI003F472E4B
MRKLIPILMLPLCLTTQAANETTHQVIITKMSTYRDYAVLYINPPFTHSQAGCLPSKSRAIIEFQDGTVDRSKMYSLAMAAAIAQKTVTLGIADCFADHPKVYRVDVNF